MWRGDRRGSSRADSANGTSGGRVSTPFTPCRRPPVSGRMTSRLRRSATVRISGDSAQRRYGHHDYYPLADGSGYRYNIIPCDPLNEEAEPVYGSPSPAYDDSFPSAPGGYSRCNTPLPAISRRSLTSSYRSPRSQKPRSLPPSGLIRLPPIGAEVYVMQKSDLEQLREEIEDEELQRDAIQKSLADLGESVKGQRHAVESNIRPGGEWKIRYEGQVKTNESLDEELRHLEEQVEMSEKRAREGMSSKPELYPDMTDAEVRQLARSLDKTRADLQRRVKDYEWRLDSESNAFHRANEEREKLILQIAEISKSIHQANLEEAEKTAKEQVHQRLVEGHSGSTTPIPKAAPVPKQRKSIPGRGDQSKTFPPPASRQKAKGGLSTTHDRK